MNFLTALANSSLPTPTSHVYIPVPSFPKSKKLFVGSKKCQLKNGLHIKSLPHINFGAIKILTLGLATAWNTFAWAIKNRKADRRVVICYNLTAPPAWPISFVSKIIQLDLVPFIGDIYVPGEVVKDTFLRRLEYNGQKRLIPKADGLLIANQAIIDDFAPNRHALLLEGGVMESLVHRFASNIAKTDDSFHIVFAGQLSVLNGVTLLLDALKLIDSPNLKVSILGGGEFAEVVRTAAETDSRITYHGLCNHEEVLKVYEQADLLLNLRKTDFQTHRYVFPSKVVECLATGRPLLTTCTGHVEKEFGDLVYLLRDESPLALSTKIQELSALPKEDRSMVGVKAQAHVMEHKTWEGHVQRLENYLHQNVFAQPKATEMKDSTKLKVLAVVDYYLPGYKGGGPAVSVSRIIGCLNQDLNFSVFTRDRDLGDQEPYKNIESNKWTKEEDMQLFYASPKNLNTLGLWRVIRNSKPDVIYLNSYFSRLTRSALILRTLGILKSTPLLIAPRGEFSPGALQLKAPKKKLYVALANFFKFHAGVTWQVSSSRELDDTKAVVHTSADYFIKAPDIVDRRSVEITTIRAKKKPGVAEFAFISRISPKKNLLGAIEMLRSIKGKVTFAIYGPIEDEAYWAECEATIATLPRNIKCVKKGGISNDQVLHRLAEHHFFLFPTLGENFGHVIPEALAAGCPVLLSDQTPWQNFAEKEVGWVLPLDDRSGWQEAIQECVDADQETFDQMSTRAKDYIAEMAQSSTDIVKNRRLFEETIENQLRHVA
jgi:glycosyltransferase involved in cell wall biosynthesis